MQYNILSSALLRVFGEQVEFIYIDASSSEGQKELVGLESNGTLELPVISAGKQVLFSGRFSAVNLVRSVKLIVDERRIR